MSSRVFYEPKKLTKDQLAYLKTEDLIRYIEEMEKIKSAAADNNYDPQKWEIELAYALREMQSREVSLGIHETFLAQQRMEERLFMEEEAELPVVNFDNFKRGNH